MSVSTRIREELQSIRQANGLVELRLNGPSKDVFEVLRHAGISFSHPHVDAEPLGPQGYLLAYVPERWVEEAADASPYEWAMTDDERARLLVPAEPLHLFVEVGDSPWSITEVRMLRPDAARLLTSFDASVA